jgi:hypothetical protein
MRSYALFTNIPHNVLVDQEAFAAYARGLYNRMLNIPLHVCPDFHLVTPESVTSASGAIQVTEFLVDLLNTRLAGITWSPVKGESPLRQLPNMVPSFRPL